MKGSAPINSTLWDKLLPSRIFSTDRYPDARLNVYSRPDILCFIVHVLKGTPELKKIMNSCFGPLFTIPVHRCPISGKLIHALLCRQLVTKQEYEMWTVFGGQPMRFSLVEFGAVTGLPCGEFPQGYDPDLDPAPLSHEEHYWDKLIGDNREFTLADVASILEDKEVEDGDRKLRLALLLIVDGVLVASRQRNRPTFKYVAMLEDVDSFLSFPWGRESFLKTISTMRPAKKKTTAKPVLKRLKRNAKCKDPLASFTHQLQQQSIRLNGFPLALQLLAFRNVSGLVDKIPGTLDSPTLIEWDSLLLPRSNLTLSDVHNVECSSNVSVDPWIHREEGWGEWDDEVKDKKVAYMVAQILNGHIFTKNEWPGGFSSLPLIKVSEKKQPDVSHRKHIVSRRKNTTRPASMRVKQPTSTSKQRRRRSKRHCVINNKDHDYPVDLEDLIQSEMVSVRNEFSLTVQKLQSRFTKLENKFKALRFQKSRKFRRLSSHRSSKKNRSSLKEDPPHPSGSLSPLIHMTDTRVEDEVHIQLSPRTVAAQGVKHKMKKYCGTEDCGSDSPCEDSTAAVRGGNPIYNTARQNEQTPPPNLPKTSSSSEPMPIYNTASSFPHMLKDSNAPDEAQTQSAIAVSSEFPSPQLAITNAPLTVCKGSKSNLTQGETSQGHKQVSPEGEPITSGGQCYG